MGYFASSGIARLVLTAILVTGLAVPTGSSAEPANELVPAQGMFLIARRELPDPNFRRTVVLLLRHGEDGTLGIVVNRLTHLLLAEVAPQIEGVEETPHRIFLGGPVALERMLVLMRDAQGLRPTEHVVDDVYFSADRGVLESLLAGAKPESQLHVYAGHAGWAPGQLEHELARGDWHLVRADLATVFDRDATTLWETLIERHEPSGILVHRGQQETGAPVHRTMRAPNGTNGIVRKPILGVESAPDLS